MGMKATFHLGQDPVTYDNRDLEIEASTIDKTVTLRVITGVDLTPEGHSVPHVAREFFMSKPQARAVASAMMGCAAEID